MNLLNVLQPASNKPSSLAEGKTDQPDSLLQDLFQQELSGKISGNADSKNPDELQETIVLAELVDPSAVAMTKPAPQLSPVVTDEKVSSQLEEKSSLPKIPQLNLKSLQLQNPLQPVTVNEGVELNDAQLMMLTQGDGADVESVKIENSSAESKNPKAASSKLSTADFLNLREMSQNIHANSKVNPVSNDAAKGMPLISQEMALGTKSLVKSKTEESPVNAKSSKEQPGIALTGMPGNPATPMMSLDATVSQASDGKPVLTAESLQHIGHQVSLMGHAKQDGEIKIRLRPDHLGEMMMSVKTQGNQVTIQIKAEHAEAKKIIEESLGALREQLSGQNLSLSRIDVVSQPTSASTADQGQLQADLNRSFDHSSSGRSDGDSQQERSGRFDSVPADEPVIPSLRSASRAANYGNSSGRLDLIA